MTREEKAREYFINCLDKVLPNEGNRINGSKLERDYKMFLAGAKWHAEQDREKAIKVFDVVRTELYRFGYGAIYEGLFNKFIEVYDNN